MKSRSFVDRTLLEKRGEWLSAHDLQEVFGIGRNTAYGIIHAMPHIKIGRSLRVKKDDLCQALETTGELPMLPREEFWGSKAKQESRRETASKEA